MACYVDASAHKFTLIRPIKDYCVCSSFLTINLDTDSRYSDFLSITSLTIEQICYLDLHIPSANSLPNTLNLNHTLISTNKYIRLLSKASLDCHLHENYRNRHFLYRRKHKLGQVLTV